MYVFINRLILSVHYYPRILGMTWRPPFFLPIVSSKCRMFYRKNVLKVEKGQTCSDHHFVLAYHVLANFKLWHILHWDQFWIGHLWADGIFTVVILTVEFCTVFLFTVGILTVGNCTVVLGGICTAGILTVGNCTVVLGGNCTAGTYTVGICTVGIASTKYLTSKDLWKIRKKDEKVFASDRARTSIIKAVTICFQFPCLYQLRHGGYCYRNGQSLII